MLPRATDRGHGRAQALVAGHAELSFQVQVRRGMKTWMRSRCGGEPSGAAMSGLCTGQRGEDGSVTAWDHPDGFGVGLGVIGNQFDDVDAQGAQLRASSACRDPQEKPEPLAVPGVVSRWSAGARHWVILDKVERSRGNRSNLSFLVRLVHYAVAGLAPSLQWPRI